ncbi:MAG: hypothetical protein ACKN9T_04690 [Candidatus Methylumidiphilus sp.]
MIDGGGAAMENRGVAQIEKRQTAIRRFVAVPRRQLVAVFLLLRAAFLQHRAQMRGELALEILGVGIAVEAGFEMVVGAA